jgi:hypothetical protein
MATAIRLTVTITIPTRFASAKDFIVPLSRFSRFAPPETSSPEGNWRFLPVQKEFENP